MNASLRVCKVSGAALVPQLSHAHARLPAKLGDGFQMPPRHAESPAPWDAGLLSSSLVEQGRHCSEDS